MARRASRLVRGVLRPPARGAGGSPRGRGRAGPAGTFALYNLCRAGPLLAALCQAAVEGLGRIGRNGRLAGGRPGAFGPRGRGRAGPAGAGGLHRRLRRRSAAYRWQPPAVVTLPPGAIRRLPRQGPPVDGHQSTPPWPGLGHWQGCSKPPRAGNRPPGIDRGPLF